MIGIGLAPGIYALLVALAPGRCSTGLFEQATSIGVLTLYFAFASNIA